MARRSSRRTARTPMSRSQWGLWVLSLIVVMMMVFALFATVLSPDLGSQQGNGISSGSLPPVATAVQPSAGQ